MTQAPASINVTNAANVAESKLRVLYEAPEKRGKSHCVASYTAAGKLLVGSAETNNDTLEGFMRAGADIEIWRLDNYGQWQNEVLPMIVNRTLDCATFALDGLAKLCNIYWAERQGTRSKLTYDDYGVGKARFINDFTQLVRAASPIEGKPSYNIVATTHLMDQLNDSGAVIGYQPAITGSFRAEVGKMFGTVLLNDVELKRSSPSEPLKPRYFCHSIPPSPLYAIGDGVGGEGKLYKALPPQVDGTYLGLCKAWGREP